MPKIDPDTSADVMTDDRRVDASARFETTVRRCQRLRRRSRSAVRARVRLGLMIGLAIALLVVLALQGSLWMRLDATSLLTSGAALIGGLAAAYVVALLALGALVKRRRVSLSKASCQSAAPSA